MKHARHIAEFGHELQNFIDAGKLETLGGRTTDQQVIDKILADVVVATTITAALARQTEYFMQGDISRSTFLQRYKEIEENFKP